MDLLSQIGALADALPSSLKGFTVAQLGRFSRLCQEYAADLASQDAASQQLGDDTTQPSYAYELPPASGSSLPHLPPEVSNILEKTTGLPSTSLRMLWASAAALCAGTEEDAIGNLCTLSPPTTTCLRDTCAHRKLVNKSVYHATLYTLKSGAMKAEVVSLYCQGCNTRYRPDFYVCAPSDKTSRRIFYSGIPAFIGVTEHSFFDIPLCRFVENMYLFSQASSEGIARVYNASLASPHAASNLRGATVLDGFLLHALLRFHHVQGRQLSIPHHSSTNRRLDEALKERNVFMMGTGQPQWAHACMGCMKIKTDANGRRYRQTACVVDGISLTHAACGYKSPEGAPCREPLAKPQDRFCLSHRDRIDFCGVADCTNACEPGHVSCALPEHRAIEDSIRDKGKSMFQLTQRLAAAQEFLTTGKKSSKNTTRSPARKGRKQKHTMVRSWTHNEELAVRCCGVIISRATCFQAEAITAVKDFMMSTFPTERYPGCKPSVIFFDNNCTLWKFINRLEPNSPTRKFFEGIALAVDVFHFRTKHTEGDLVCQTHCNAANFPDLLNADGTWAYNSSAAEQANRWIKKYKGIVREMDVPCFNFFLDEMISLRNEFIVQGLEQKGLMPHIVPESALLNAEPVPL